MAMSDSEWVRAAWKKEVANEYFSVTKEARQAMKEIGETRSLGEEGIKMYREQLHDTRKDVHLWATSKFFRDVYYSVITCYKINEN